MSKKLIVVISGPSGVGKTVTVDRLLKIIPSSAQLATTTTRLPRDGEVHGKDYWFTSREEFLARVEQNDFIEWVESYGFLYGISNSKLTPLLESYSVVFIVCDTRGAFSVKEKFPQAVLIFIKPSSLDELEKRIRGRQTNSEEVQKRMSAAQKKIEQAGKFDYTVTNTEGKLDTTVSEVQEIVEKHLVWRLGIDLDGVIIDHTENKILIARRLGINLRPEETPSNIMRDKLKPATYKQIKKVVYDDPSVAMLAPPMSHSQEVLTQLQDDGLPFCLISMRPTIEGAIGWLNTHGFWNKYFDKDNTSFVKKRAEKETVARSLLLDAYLDDEPNTLEMMLSIPHRFLFDPFEVYPQNKSYTKVRSWLEFRDAIYSL